MTEPKSYKCRVCGKWVHPLNYELRDSPDASHTVHYDMGYRFETCSSECARVAFLVHELRPDDPDRRNPE